MLGWHMARRYSHWGLKLCKISSSGGDVWVGGGGERRPHATLALCIGACGGYVGGRPLGCYVGGRPVDGTAQSRRRAHLSLR